MSYEVLARKLRPSGFASLVGQDHVVRALTHALDHDRLHHAYLFTGTRGVGKTTIARILAKSLNCEQGVSATPCGQCSICTEVKENRFIDLIEVDAASRTGVDDTRELLENAQYMPTRGRYKVYLIDEVHMLSIASFNALLKTLEEPPEHVKFLLATTDPKKVPVTVLSRCLQFQLKNISGQTIAEYIAGVLTDEAVTFESEALDVIARSAQGSMRDALSLTDQAIAFGQGELKQADVTEMLGVVGRNEIEALMAALQSADATALLGLSAELAERNADFADVLTGLMEALHDASVAVATAQAQGPFLPDELQLYYQIALIGLRDLPIAPDPRSGFEMTLLRMLAFTPERDGTVAPRTPSARSGQSDSSGEAPAGKQVQPASGDTVAAHPESDQHRVSQRAETKPQSHLEGTLKSETSAPEAPAQAAALPEQTLTAPDAGIGQQTNDTPGAKPQANQEAEKRAAEDSEERQTTGKFSSADADSLERWYAIVAELNMGGVAKMIAEHSVPEFLDQTSAHLVLSVEHDTLLSDAQVINLRRGLEDCLGHPMQVEIRVGVLGSETPAQRRGRLLAERQAAAEESMRQDSTVQGLLAEFDGKLEEVRLH
jgi:DNA polymerase-3 subunit gamma/tau